MNRNPTKNNYRSTSLRGQKSARTVLLRMAADQERADRIRALKQERPDLTWRRIADHVGVTERAASDWQKKGGIDYANAKKLADILEVDIDYIWRGDIPADVAPSPFAGPDATQDRLDSIDERLTRLEALLERVLDRRSEQGADIIGRLASLEDALTGRVEAVDERLRALGLAVAHPAEPSAPPREPAQRAVSRSKRAAAPRIP